MTLLFIPLLSHVQLVTIFKRSPSRHVTQDTCVLPYLQLFALLYIVIYPYCSFLFETHNTLLPPSTTRYTFLMVMTPHHTHTILCFLFDIDYVGPPIQYTLYFMLVQNVSTYCSPTLIHINSCLNSCYDKRYNTHFTFNVE